MLKLFFTLRLKYFFLFALGLYMLLHLPFTNLPPTGNHVWRQSNTLAIAKNFYEEGMNILEPKIDKRFDGSGVTGSNFPLYEWVLAVNYKVWGFRHSVHRIYAMILTFICFVLVYLNFRPLSVQSARMASWIFLFNPLIFFYGFSALPDIMAILFLLMANYCIYAIIERKGIIFSILLPLFLSLGLLIKFTYILWLVFPFLLLPSVRVKPKIPQLILLILSSVIPVFIWYEYANQLTALAQGNVEFVYYARALNSLREWKELSKSLLSVGTELFFGYPALVLLVLGLIVGYSNKSKARVHWFYKAGAILMGLVYFFSASKNLLDHDYYLLPFLALTLWVLSRVPKKGFQVLVILLLSMPLWSGLRITTANWYGVNAYEWEQEKKWLDQRIKKSERVICGVDQTSCYMFYMLDVKGFPYRYTGELEEMKNGEMNIESYIHQGARYFITNQAMDLKNKNLKKYYSHIEPISKKMWLVTLEQTKKAHN